MNGGRTWSATDDCTLTAMYESGSTLAVIAEALSRTVSAIDSRANILVLRRPEGCGIRFLPWSEDTFQTAIKLYTMGFPLRVIAKSINRSVVSVKRMVTTRQWCKLPRQIPDASYFDSNVEVWRPLTVCSDYAVSNLGNLKSLMFGKVGNDVKLWLDKHGYLQVTLQFEGEAKRFAVHRLVAFAFIGEPPTEHHQAAHGDGDSSNNKVTNLRWATPTENYADRCRHGTAPRYKHGPWRQAAPLHDRNAAVARANL